MHFNYSKMKKIFLTIFIVNLMVNFSEAFSQENTPIRELQLGTGYSHMRFLDKQVSPLVYNSHSPIIDFRFQKRTENRIFNVDLTVCPGVNRPNEHKNRDIKYEYATLDGELKSFEFQLYNTFQFLNNADVNYLIKLNKYSNDRLKIYTGGLFKQSFLFSMTFSPIFVMSEISLGPKIYLDYSLNESISFSSSISTPIISLISRLPPHRLRKRKAFTSSAEARCRTSIS